MPKQQSKPVIGGEKKDPIKALTEALSGLSGGILKRKPELDELEKQLKKSAQAKREALRKSPKMGEVIMADLLYEAENAFIEKDVKRDLNIKDPAKIEEIRELYRAYVRENLKVQEMIAIVQSGEWEKLTAHVEQIATYTKLDEIIAKCETSGNSEAWQAFKEKHPLLAMASSYLISWHLGNKEKKDYTKLDKKLASIAKVLEGEEGKEEGEEKGTEPAESAKKVELADLNQNQKDAIKPLQDAGFDIDLSTVEADVTALSKIYSQEETIEFAKKGATDGSQFSRIAKAMQNRLGAQKMQFRLADVYMLERITDGQVGIVVKAIEKVNKKPEDMRKALRNMRRIQSGDTSETTIAQHLGISAEGAIEQTDESSAAA